jgi:putative ATPase
MCLVTGGSVMTAPKRAEPMPLWIRNAPTDLMKSLGYSKACKYAHDEADGVYAMDCLPGNVEGRRHYRPKGRGREKDIATRLEAARLIRDKR